MRTLCISLFAMVVGGSAVSLAGCGGDDNTDPTTMDGGGPDSKPSVDGGPVEGDGAVVDGNKADAKDGGGPLEFTTFVKQLIVTQTKEDNLPTTTEDKTFVDSMDPNAFPPAFFP